MRRVSPSVRKKLRIFVSDRNERIGERPRMPILKLSAVS
jgi:hypothetical protein